MKLTYLLISALTVAAASNSQPSGTALVPPTAAPAPKVLVGTLVTRQQTILLDDTNIQTHSKHTTNFWAGIDTDDLIGK